MASKKTKSTVKDVLKMAAGVALGTTVGVSIVNYITSKVKA